MKVVTLSANSTTDYEDVEFSQRQNQTKFGTMLYFKERIYFIKDKATGEYGLWRSGEGVSHLVVNDFELKQEIAALKKALSLKMPSLQWKDVDAATSLFIRVDKDCTPILLNKELRYVVSIYGVFLQRASHKSFLQMSLIENESSAISFLNVPIAAAAAGLNYTPNSNI